MALMRFSDALPARASSRNRSVSETINTTGGPVSRGILTRRRRVAQALRRSTQRLAASPLLR